MVRSNILLPFQTNVFQAGKGLWRMILTFYILLRKGTRLISEPLSLELSAGKDGFHNTSLLWKPFNTVVFPNLDQAVAKRNPDPLRKEVVMDVSLLRYALRKKKQCTFVLRVHIRERFQKHQTSSKWIHFHVSEQNCALNESCSVLTKKTSVLPHQNELDSRKLGRFRGSETCFLHDDMSRFALLFPILREIDWSSFFQDGNHNNSPTYHIVLEVWCWYRYQSMSEIPPGVSHWQLSWPAWSAECGFWDSARWSPYLCLKHACQCG